MSIKEMINMKPTMADIRYKGLSIEETRRQYERDLLLWEQNEMISNAIEEQRRRDRNAFLTPSNTDTYNPNELYSGDDIDLYMLDIDKIIERDSKKANENSEPEEELTEEIKLKREYAELERETNRLSDKFEKVTFQHPHFTSPKDMEWYLFFKTLNLYVLGIYALINYSVNKNKQAIISLIIMVGIYIIIKIIQAIHLNFYYLKVSDFENKKDKAVKNIVKEEKEIDDKKRIIREKLRELKKEDK